MLSDSRITKKKIAEMITTLVNFSPVYFTCMKNSTTTDALKVAITKANNWTPDVIVMDLAMPRLDGWSASKSLKSSPATAHIPIIALSAASEAREGARACGCDGFLAKPCQPDLLWWEIRALLNPAS